MKILWWKKDPRKKEKKEKPEKDSTSKDVIKKIKTRNELLEEAAKP